MHSIMFTKGLPLKLCPLGYRGNFGHSLVIMKTLISLLRLELIGVVTKLFRKVDLKGQTCPPLTKSFSLKNTPNQQCPDTENKPDAFM